MSVSTVPCDLHEITNCSVCTGLDKKLEAENHESTGPMTWDQAQSLGSPPPGYVWAMYPGKCAGCGEPFKAGEPIRFSKSANGWVPAVCC